MSDAVLDIADLRVELHVRGSKRVVIHRSSLSIAEGEAVGLVGESGSGKSMTIRAIVGLLPRKATVQGSVVVHGQAVAGLRGKRLRQYRREDVALIHQDPRAHINPVRSVGDFMTEALVARGVAREEALRRAEEALVSVGIADGGRRLAQLPSQLSGGLLQRVMIATAIIAQPRLLLADEPTTALDVTTQEEVMAIINEQRAERHLSMLFISHDLELTAAVTDRIAVMYAGVLVEDGPTEGLHEQALHPYTVGLLAARTSGESAGKRLWAIPGRPRSAFEVGPGCVFESRCPFAVQRCRAERPALEALDGRKVACHRAAELRGKIDYSQAGA